MQPEPELFEVLVRSPGNAFLVQTPKPTAKQWKSHAYWQRVGRELYIAYRKICAYTCHFIADDTGVSSVDHFQSKDRRPDLAYEWSNYRLACLRLNGRKHTKEILDPFEIQDDWFTLKFPVLHVVPHPDLSQEMAATVQKTIDALGLCDEESCVAARARYLDCYCRDVFPFEHLEEEAPFLAKELTRQGLVLSIKDIWLNP